MAETTRKEKMLKQDPLTQELARIFGDNVAVLRTHNNLSQEKLAFMAKTSRSHVSDIESGVINARFSDIVDFARAFDQPLEALMAPNGARRALEDPHSRL